MRDTATFLSLKSFISMNFKASLYTLHPYAVVNYDISVLREIRRRFFLEIDYVYFEAMVLSQDIGNLRSIFRGYSSFVEYAIRVLSFAICFTTFYQY